MAAASSVIFSAIISLIIPAVVLAQPAGTAATRERFYTTGFMLGMSLEAAAPMTVDHTVENTRLQMTTSGTQFVPYDSTYRVQTSTGVLIAIRGGWAVSPWATPFVNFSLGRGGRKQPGEKWWVDQIYSEIGSRINLAIPRSRVVPYLSGALAYRSVSHVRTTGSSTKGNITTVYYDKEESYSGGATALGIGLLYKGLDVSYTVSTGRPNPDEWEVNGRNTQMRSARIAVGMTAYRGMMR